MVKGVESSFCFDNDQDLVLQKRNLGKMEHPLGPSQITSVYFWTFFDPPTH